jgi:hypothetical protein
VSNHDPYSDRQGEGKETPPERPPIRIHVGRGFTVRSSLPLRQINSCIAIQIIHVWIGGVPFLLPRRAGCGERTHDTASGLRRESEATTYR